VLLRRGHFDQPQQVVAVPDTLGLPVIVKPAREGSSIGVVKVTGYSDMQAAVDAGRRNWTRRAVRAVHQRRRGHLPGHRQRRRCARACR
jgi:D-alanine-D-alanine ligase-like ATP-grasp enzyme